MDRMVEHLQQGITHLALSDPQTLKNTEHSFVSYWPTGQELLDIYTKVNGKQAQIKNWTPQDRDEMNADGANFGPTKVGYWDKWQDDDWQYDSGGKVYDRTYKGVSLEEVARRFV